MMREISAESGQGSVWREVVERAACRQWCYQGGCLRLAYQASAALEDSPVEPGIHFPLTMQQARARPSLLKGWSRHRT